ncbi:MAG: hypothetical protein D6816_13950, partial [Bacteroidetes bacterium]
MTNPEPDNPNSQPQGILKSLIEAFNKLPPLLSYGGLIFIAAFVFLYFIGSLPDNLLYVPLVAVIAFLIYTYMERRFEIQRMTIERVPPKPSEPQPGPEPKPPEPPDDDWEVRYLKRLAARCEMLPMEAIDKTAARTDAAKVALNRVFTQVDVNRSLTEEEAQQMAHRQREPEERREPAIAAIGRRENKYLVLLGKPGSGKSTLVDYIALCLAGETLRRPGDPAVADLEKQKWVVGWLLPVRVILREYAERGLSQKRSLWHYITDELARPDEDGQSLTACANQLRHHLEKQGGLLLLDGLDEVPDAHRWRERLRQEIR